MNTNEHEIVFVGEVGICFCAVLGCFGQTQCPSHAVQLIQDLRVYSCSFVVKEKGNHEWTLMNTNEHEIVFVGEVGICFCAVTGCFRQAECPRQSAQ